VSHKDIKFKLTICLVKGIRFTPSLLCISLETVTVDEISHIMQEI